MAELLGVSQAEVSKMARRAELGNIRPGDVHRANLIGPHSQLEPQFHVEVTGI